MTRYDFSPLFRNSVGFDRLADLVDVAVDEAFEEDRATKHRVRELV